MSKVVLYNGVELAEAMRVNRTYVSAMKAYPKDPYEFTHGHQTTLESALEWRQRNSEFRMAEVYRRKPKTKTEPAHVS